MQSGALGENVTQNAFAAFGNTVVNPLDPIGHILLPKPDNYCSVDGSLGGKHIRSRSHPSLYQLASCHRSLSQPEICAVSLPPSAATRVREMMGWM